MSHIKHLCSLFITLILVGILFSCSTNDKETPNTVLVSLAPYKYFVEQIAGDTVQVKMMVPTGGSPHSYEPTARQILDASKAQVWFQIGEPFEERAVKAMTSYGSDMKIIDMRKGLDLIALEEDGHGHCKHHDCKDPHIWLSPRLVKKQAERISKTLSKIYPDNKETYHKNLRKFQKNLDDLDFEISSMLHSMKNRTILVSHPAFGYYCKDYGLKQISIEFEGKEPSPQHLTKILNLARKNESPFVFAQTQHLSKGAKLVADEIGAEIIEVDPLAENYKENMLSLTRSFSAQ